jgi:O-antigen/teichoic acid export membrane protein
LVLLPYGPTYVHAGAPVLRLLAGASAFRAIIALYSAVCRIEGNAARVLAIQAAVFVIVIGLTLVFGHSEGLMGVGLAWLIANVIAACAVAAPMIRVLLRGSSRRAMTARGEGV